MGTLGSLSQLGFVGETGLGSGGGSVGFAAGIVENAGMS